jgi:hypothetical protein
MRCRTFLVSFLLFLLLTLKSFSAPEQDISKTKFKCERANLAQKVYNKAVEEAWKQYQIQVEKAAADYKRALEQAYKEQLAKENLEESIEIRNEIKRISVDLQEDLVLYFSFNKPDIGGEVLDQSPEGNHGRVSGAKWIEDGKIGGCYLFDKTKKKDCIIVPDDNSLDCRRITVAAWIKAKGNDDNWNRIVDKDCWHGYSLCLGGTAGNVVRNGRACFERGKDDKGFCAVVSDEILTDGTWHHIVATYDGDILMMYIDGSIQERKRETKKLIEANDLDIGIGNNPVDEDVAFDGWIDEVRIYNRALSSKEVYALYDLK